MPKGFNSLFRENDQFISGLTTTLAVPPSHGNFIITKDGKASSDMSYPKLIPKTVIFLDGSCPYTLLFLDFSTFFGGLEGSILIYILYYSQ